jgi:hypothetical protein
MFLKQILTNIEKHHGQMLCVRDAIKSPSKQQQQTLSVENYSADQPIFISVRDCKIVVDCRPLSEIPDGAVIYNGSVFVDVDVPVVSLCNCTCDKSYTILYRFLAATIAVAN